MRDHEYVEVQGQYVEVKRDKSFEYGSWYNLSLDDGSRIGHVVNSGNGWHAVSTKEAPVGQYGENTSSLGHFRTRVKAIDEVLWTWKEL